MGQVEMAGKNNIALQPIKKSDFARCTVAMLEGEIPGATVYYHTMLAGDKVFYQASPEVLKTFLHMDGVIKIRQKGTDREFNQTASYVADPKEDIELISVTCSHFLEIQWKLEPQDQEFLKENRTTFPLVQIYSECEQYRETFKSEKTISRSIIDHHALPRFCMGSNEAFGPDRVEPHAHPLLDQFFFSFPENDVNLLIDDMVQPYEGNTLIHIPLGSNHGVEILEGGKMHYVWIDFIINPQGVEYLDEVHVKTGVKQSFDENKQITQ